MRNFGLYGIALAMGVLLGVSGGIIAGATSGQDGIDSGDLERVLQANRTHTVSEKTLGELSSDGIRREASRIGDATAGYDLAGSNSEAQEKDELSFAQRELTVLPSTTARGETRLASELSEATELARGSVDVRQGGGQSINSPSPLESGEVQRDLSQNVIPGHTSNEVAGPPLVITVGAGPGVAFSQASREVQSAVRFILLVDVNRDEVVDKEDLLLVAGSLGTLTLGLFDVDVNGDGIVDVFDLALVASNLGEIVQIPGS